VLVVDDEPLVRAAVVQILTHAGYAVLAAGTVAEARTRLLEHDVDVMVCDVRLPDGSGVELVQATAEQLPDVAVVMLTGVDDPDLAAEVFRLGAAAYVVKPFGGNEILINVANALRLRDLERGRRAQEAEMERKLVDRTRSLQSALRQLEAGASRSPLDDRESADRLAAALSLRHEETGRHIERVGLYAGLLAEAGGWTEWTPEAIRVAAMLHDVGKLGIPDTILMKAGPLDEDELAVIRRHPQLGHSLLAGSASPVVALGASTALTHHERWDGDGYPQRLVGTHIPIEGRIAALADVFDAMTSHRAYRRAMPVDRVVEHITGQRGRHFDPELVDLFTGLVDDFLLVMAGHPPEPERALRVLVVDGHAMYAESVVRLLDRDPGLEVAATAGSVAQAVAAATELRPDVVLLDVDLPDGDGLTAVLRLRQASPASQVVLLSQAGADLSVPDALRAGCAGFLPKNDALHQLARVVRAASDGEPVLPAGTMPQVLGALQRDALRRTGTLSRREVEVLGHVARGLGVPAVADLLGTSSASVREVLQEAMAKLGVSTRLEAVVAAVRQGLVRVA
jgi:putative two-component system response regulator